MHANDRQGQALQMTLDTNSNVGAARMERHSPLSQSGSTERRFWAEIWAEGAAERRAHTQVAPKVCDDIGAPIRGVGAPAHSQLRSEDQLTPKNGTKLLGLGGSGLSGARPGTNELPIGSKADAGIPSTGVGGPAQATTVKLGPRGLAPAPYRSSPSVQSSKGKQKPHLPAVVSDEPPLKFDQLPVNQVDTNTNPNLDTFAAAQAWARAEARAKAEASATLRKRAHIEVEEEATKSAQAEQEAQADIEAKLLLAKKRTYIRELELDVAQRTRAAEDLKHDIEIVSQEAEAASAHAKTLQRQWQTMQSSQGPLVEQLESMLASEEKEVVNLESVAAEMHSEKVGRSQSDNHRLWWLEKVAGLDYELRECRRQLEPLQLELGVLNEQLQRSTLESQDLQSELQGLEAAYAAVGVDVAGLRSSSPGLEELDLILELCLAILPRTAEVASPRVPTPVVAATTAPSGPTPLELARRKPPLLPDNVGVPIMAPYPGSY
mmetsp:Transcript_7137/g.17765  ORF Transcript_7137/g.17765 Transcript_7137/m.17765 type:complete len:492 (-) Transcript_7137:103-1578(-)